MTNLNFNEVNYDGDLEDADEDDLRSLVEQFEAAQEENAAEFEAAAETIEELDEVDVEDFQSARANLIETITEFESFESSPTEEADLEDAEFAKLREHEAYFADLEADAAEDDEDEEFADMGTEGKTQEGEDEKTFDDKARTVVGGVAGVNLRED